MFKKIVSNLPFSPALIGQLGFYARRLRKEETTRRLGLIFTVFALAIQTFAFVNPPEAQATASNNNVIFQGVSSKSDLLNIFDANQDGAGHRDIQQIYAQFGVSRQDIVNARTGTFNSRDHNLGILSVGRKSYDASNEKQVAIAGTDTTLFARNLWRFDSLPGTIQNGSTYNGIIGQRAADGQWFAISFDCGNVAFLNYYNPPKPKAACESLVVTPLTRTTFRLTTKAIISGDVTINGYEFRVNGTDISRSVQTSSKIASVDVEITKVGTYQAASSVATNLGYMASVACIKTIKVDAAPVTACENLAVSPNSRTNFTLRATATADNGAGITRYDFTITNKSGKTVFTKQINGNGKAASAVVDLTTAGTYAAKVVVQTTLGPRTNDDCTMPITVKEQPVASCESLTVGPTKRTSFKLVAKANADGGATISKYTFKVTDKDGKTVVSKSIASKDSPVTTDIDVTKEGTYTAQVTVTTSVGDKTATKCKQNFKVAPEDSCVLNPDYPKSSPECKPCVDEPTLWYKDERCKPIYEESKKVTNATTSLTDANNSTAKASDRIAYTLTAKNIGNATGSYTMKEDLGDVLEYADLLDASGGILDKATNVITWPAASVKANASLTRTVLVQVKTVIPATSQNAGNPESYNCLMTNVFGSTDHSTTNVKIDCPPTKTIEGVVKTLPATGPGDNLIFGGITLMVATYFFARSRQLNKEVRIVRKHFAVGTL